MDKKTMIVVWKWNVGWTVESGEQKKGWKYYDFIKCENSFTMEVERDTSAAYKFIGFTKTKSNTCREGGPASYTDNDIIETCTHLANSRDKVLLLLHGGEPDKFGINSNVYKQLFNKKNIHVDFFKGYIGAIYDHIIDGNYTYFKEDAITVPANGCIKIKKNNFDQVWNHYYEHYYINLLKELTVLWFPLTTDIQGLSKLKQDGSSEKYQEYLNEVKTKWHEEKKSLKENHDKIIKRLENEENKEEMNSLKDKYSKIIKCLESGSISDITEDMLVN
jgi:hypothetical protein